ncbi:hypothetical protein H0H93_010359, partial [Arthromyces matolae]
FIDVVTGNSYNAVLSYLGSKWTIDTFEKLPEVLHSQISVEELVAAEKVVQQSPLVQKLAAEVGVAPHQITCDGWSIGYDERFPQHRRVQQALAYARFSEHDNLYAHPLDFIPVLDANVEEVIHIGSLFNDPSHSITHCPTDFPPTYKRSPNGPVLSAPSTAPPSISSIEDSLAASGRERIPPPLPGQNFLTDLMLEDNKNFKLRTDLKPLHIVQPEGVSFKINGHELEWQNWNMHVGKYDAYQDILFVVLTFFQAFSQREGIALSTITYNDNGEIRPIAYRLSLAEMVVPYGAPEYPHPRKFAFDSGEYGMGTQANELSLGCDCVGQIHYLPGAYVGHNGTAAIINNVICIHEEDAGVLWKHTDYRPGGRSRTVRRRRLVVNGSIEFEVRLTGILNVYVADKDEPSPYGTIVAPGINAQNHQHFFCLRIDPMVDGLRNTVIESDIVPLPEAPTGSAANFAGNAFVSQETKITKEAGRPFDYLKERRWKIINSARSHYSSGSNVGYSIGLKGGATPMMARPNSWAAKRAAFLTNQLWVI